MSLILGPACSLALAQAQTKPNLSGTWKADIAKSNFGAMPVPQSSVSRIEHQDPSLKVSTTSVSDRGERTMEFTFTTDGSESTNLIGSVEVKSKARWEGNVLWIESKANTDSGEITVKDKFSLSEDGKTLTLNRTFSGAMGETVQTVIHEKQ